MTVFATTTITADEVYESGRDGHDTVQVSATEFDSVHVSFGENGHQPECRYCHEPIDQHETDHPEQLSDGQVMFEGWATYRGPSFSCPEADMVTCPTCEGEGVLDDPDNEGETIYCPTCDDEQEIHGPHEPETGPNTWCNSASVSADEDGDSVTVTISVGDPRGAFAFTVRRLSDTAPEHAGRLIMHTPYPGEGMPHERLTELRPGTFLIG